MITRIAIYILVVGLLASLGWRIWRQRYQDGYRAGVAELDAKVRAEGEKVTALRLELGEAKKRAATEAVEAYRANVAQQKEKDDAETVALLASKQRTIGRLRDSLAASGGGALRPNPTDACGTDKLRAFDLDAQLREGQRVAVEGGELLAESAGVVAACEAGARRDAAVITLAKRWAEAVQR